MDILSFSLKGFKKGMVLSVLILLTLVSITPILLLAPTGGVGSVAASQTNSLQADQRSGEYSLDDVQAEYSAYATDGNGYFGAKMRKLDFNGDGVIDLAISQPGKGTVYILDGQTQLKFPELTVTPATATWTISGGSYFGTDFSVGDVNGDGADDVLGVYGGSSGTRAMLYYGGSYVNSVSEFPSANATFSLMSPGYYGSYCAIGDLDGDGFGDVIAGDGGYNYQYIYPPDPRVPAGYNYVIYQNYGQCKWWFGGNETDLLEGGYSYSSSDGTVTPPRTSYYDYGTYIRYYHYGYFGTGGAATGDMNGDGRDEIALGGPQGYDLHQSQYSAGNIYIISPQDTIRSFDEGIFGNTIESINWLRYYGANYYDSIGADPQFADYNNDGFDDLIFNSGMYTYSTIYDNGKYCWIVDGSSSLPTGNYSFGSEHYTIQFRTSEFSRGFGSHAFGDFDGNGKLDLALGLYSPGRVYVILNEDYNGKTGNIEVSSISSFTVYPPSGSIRYAYPTEYYRYYSYNYGHVYSTLNFYNRDDDGLDDLFIADPGKTVQGVGNAGEIYGISNKDMFGVKDFRTSDGDLPDGKTYYAEYKSYKFIGSAWNKWDLWGSTMEWTFQIGNYHATVRYSNPTHMPNQGTIEEVDDEYDIIRLKEGSMIEREDRDNDTLEVEFQVLFTSNLPVEGDLDVIFDAQCAHISYVKEIKALGAVKNRFFFQGELKAYYMSGDDEIVEVPQNGWVLDNTEVYFTGVKLVYNGTQDFMQDFGEPPLYPRNDLFNITLINNLGFTDVDDSSSAREILVGGNVGDLPMAVEFQIDQDGIPKHRVLNEVPDFIVNVDVDVPTAPPGVVIHADSFDDPNTIVDNDDEIYVTWHEPAEFNSGVDYYEVNYDGEIIQTEALFAKIKINGTGTIEVSVRAIDRVAHVGEWTTSSILIDTESLEFSNPIPDSTAGTMWFNTLTPEVGITVTDLGGRAVIGNSIDFIVSHDSGETWGEWISADIGLSAKSLDVKVNPMLVEGSSNMIMFRATDEAGNVLESEPYPIDVDISSIEFGEVRVDDSADWEGIWLDNSTIDIELDVLDPLSGINGDSIEYKFTTSGRADLNSVEWISLPSGSGDEITVSIDDLELDMGDRNFIQFRGLDSVGNPYAYSDVFNIWINTVPEPVIVSPEQGAEFLEGDTIVFGSSLSMDMDGDILYYTWKHTYMLDGEEQIDIIIGEEATMEDRIEEILTPGEHSITLTVSDGLHEVVSDPVVININEVIVPIWYSSEDTDGDGMPNYWEYTYYLGWDDDSNKDTLYDQSMAGLDRKDLFDELRSQFANDTSAVSSSNDADGDGHTDFEEYLYGSDPTDALKFPVYMKVGEEVGEESDLLIPILLSISIIVIVILIILLVVFNGYLKSKVEASKIKEAEEESQLAENSLSSGGKERLEQLLASARGEGVPAMPGMTNAAALPAAEPGMGEAQPMEAQPMEAQPMEAAPMTPEGMQAAPMTAPDQQM